MYYQKNFRESTGLTLQKIAFLVWFFLPLLLWIFASILLPFKQVPVEIVEDTCHIRSYYESLNETSCSLEITFNQNVFPGDVVTVAFYDEENNHLGNWYIPVFDSSEYGTQMHSTDFSIDGKVDSYEIIDYSQICSAEKDSIAIKLTDWAFARFIYAFSFTFCAMLLNCKRFRIGEHYVVVYAGWTHHYLKIDGLKMDEKVELFSFTGITLTGSTAEGDQLEVYISRSTNHISLRRNGVLQQPID